MLHSIKLQPGPFELPILSITKPLLIFCDGNAYGKIYKATIEWQPEIYILRDFVDGVPSIEALLEPTTWEESYQPEPLRQEGDQTVAILCSSGTTGLPKAVCISNNRLMPSQSLSSGSVIFTWGTLSWISRLWGLVNSTALTCTQQNFLFVVDRKKEILKIQQRPYWKWKNYAKGGAGFV